MRQSTHPHQIHHEFLSETGLFGYVIFFIVYIFFFIS
jgi:O-antigen ligase